ncbi:hypothetical protein ANME2D_02264 [Candidatus Methanoperedens nitroreducens]|uniref:Uncharacterized protein n=1 Tax=Candidatus Methanoperedens nitratireducens TaxID=1392998 RepID=A0A062UX12_9EURY|nr:hypothetical protein [Candidatus Methanoperedens nitroreducens]KCZ71531.1 hypothetical protein ANME2D_02264 [Candidatus Methanoperedens nitroreducens]MDJ1421160.1 hypothetical protein [Candidatus Methanoperedens sp.]
MKKKTILVTGILGILLVFGAAVALAQNTGSEKTKNAENHECTPEMMESMTEDCPGQMMQSGACESMMNAAGGSSMEAGCSKMMNNNKRSAENTEPAEADHCADMGSGMGSMMGSMMGSSTEVSGTVL